MYSLLVASSASVLSHTALRAPVNDRCTKYGCLADGSTGRLEWRRSAICEYVVSGFSRTATGPRADFESAPNLLVFCDVVFLGRAASRRRFFIASSCREAQLTEIAKTRSPGSLRHRGFLRAFVSSWYRERGRRIRLPAAGAHPPRLAALTTAPRHILGTSLAHVVASAAFCVFSSDFCATDNDRCTNTAALPTDPPTA